MALESGKYTIAWFKLAEFVWRKEKERALAIYKLLAHSLYDDALASQLEGDILLSFNDQKGLSSHARAAALYEKHQKFSQAAVLYENLSFLMPDIFEYSYKAMHLYAKLNNTKKFSKSVGSLTTLISKQQLYHEIDILAQTIALPEHHTEFYDKMLIRMVTDNTSEAIVQQYLHKALENHAKYNSLPDTLLSKLRAVDEKIYAYACDLVTQQK